MPATLEPENAEKFASGGQRFVTIKDAIKEYHDACLLGAKPPFHEMVTALIERGYDQDFQNDSFFDALCLTHTMLMTSLKSVKILTEGGGNFWDALERPFSSAAENLTKTGGRIKMIVVNASPECIKSLESMKLRFGTVFEYVLAVGTTRLGHFIVCDSKMVRIEEPHKTLTIDSPATVIKAKVNFKTPLLAERQENLFDSIWTRLQSAGLPA